MFFLCHAMHFSLWATLGPRYRAITLLEEGCQAGCIAKLQDAGFVEM
jgi:hypothetical protein